MTSTIEPQQRNPKVRRVYLVLWGLGLAIYLSSLFIDHSTPLSGGAQLLGSAILPIGFLLSVVTARRPLLSGGLWVASALGQLAFALACR
ncbi:hypothetical protein FBZ89_109216 [Nitrospirillum amazonense]|uniref:Uncharacterized protein n=1 Tax=Nitrospirillum amazonense TaxID=28077 RepID=A0A560FB72_9PROT|nr:hypothetical protein [Nitrospirillum amazonense]TWB18830.1 hypothetical protein FBZ89_109216 [Nitrospirillum amazonense]